MQKNPLRFYKHSRQIFFKLIVQEVLLGIFSKTRSTGGFWGNKRGLKGKIKNLAQHLSITDKGLFKNYGYFSEKKNIYS